MDMASNVRSETEEYPMPSVHQSYSDRRSYLTKPYADYTTCQKLEIEKSTLKFLKACKMCKRPPQSLRIRGCAVIDDIIKLPRFSEIESEMLENAIVIKNNLISNLNDIFKSSNECHTYLCKKDKQKMEEHFSKKLKFYLEQDETKWAHWPHKSTFINKHTLEKGKKVKNFKVRSNRRKRKTERDANRALKNSSVIVMVNEEVPLGAIALLGKGLNYIPTPAVNPRQEQLDMRLTQNQILKVANKSSNYPVAYSSCIPSSLFRTYYGACNPADENDVNAIVDKMVNDHNIKLQKCKRNKHQCNITKDEENGLKWLIKKTATGEISVVKADKGGALLIVYPDLLKRKVLEKLENEDLYMQFKDDPSDKLYSELFDLWVDGKLKGYISPEEAKAVMGITERNNKSTSPHFKPGTSYFYPMLKIHKLKKEEVTVGADPPARLVTALQEGITKRSDVFIAKTFVQLLEKDFCKDLLKDTNGALLWLDDIDRKSSVQCKKTYKSFTFDYKSLYDSLKPDLVIEALNTAMAECRLDWSDDFRCWILQLVQLSLKAAVGKYQGRWYRQKKGIPTGGSLCVELANITVFYVMRKKVYCNSNLMRHVVHIKRYIDDGAGFFTGSQRQFEYWLKSVNLALQPDGLHIDESTFEDVGISVPFLDIRFCFDIDGMLFTRLVYQTNGF